jgi:hypothetical protein
MTEMFPTRVTLQSQDDTPLVAPRTVEQGAGPIQWLYDPVSRAFLWEPETPVDLTAVNASIASIAASLESHKSSSDHDGRYLTETEADARFSPIAGSSSIVTVGTLASLTVSGTVTAPTISGSTASGGNLTISSTSHATKGVVNVNGAVINASGDVVLGASKTIAWVQVSGGSSPKLAATGSVLDIYSNAGAASNISIAARNTTFRAPLQVLSGTGVVISCPSGVASGANLVDFLIGTTSYLKINSAGIPILGGIREAADDAAAAALSPAVPVNGLYRTGSTIKIMVS